MSYLKKKGGSIAAAARNPAQAIKNPVVKRDLITTGLLMTGNPAAAGVGLARAFNANKGGSGGGAQGGPASTARGLFGGGIGGKALLDAQKEQERKKKLESLQVKDNSSAWLKLQQDRQKIEQQQAVDDATAQGGASRADAMDQLAMRGGLSSGARERVAADSMGSINMSRQGVARQGELARLGLATEAEKMSQDIGRFNASQALGLEGMEREDTRYGQDQAAKRAAAEATANAMRDAANRKSGLEQFGSGVSTGFKSIINPGGRK